MNATVIDLRTRQPIRQPDTEGNVKREVQAECQRRGLTQAATFDCLNTALGTLVFGMGADRAIAAGKNRAADHQNGRVKVSPSDYMPPPAA